MDQVADAFAHGGPFMLVVSVAFLLLVPHALLRLAIAGRRRWPGLGLDSVGLLLSLGLLGCFEGLLLAVEATQHASPEHQARMLEAGQEVSLIPGQAAVILAAVLVPLHLAALLRARGRPRPRLQRPALVASGLLWVLDVAAAVVLGLLLLQLGALPSSGWADAAWRRAELLVTAGTGIAGLAVLSALPAGVLALASVLLGPPREAPPAAAAT